MLGKPSGLVLATVEVGLKRRLLLRSHLQVPADVHSPPLRISDILKVPEAISIDGRILTQRQPTQQ